MSGCQPFLRRRILMGTIILGLANAFFLTGVDQAAAEDPTVFAFFQKLEVSPEPFSDDYAYWKGMGKFAGSNQPYRLEVKLHTADKAPSNTVPGLINLAKISYTITTLKGDVVKAVELSGTVNLNDRTMALSNGDGDQMMGIIKAIWVRQPEKNARGPQLIHGQLYCASGI